MVVCNRCKKEIKEINQPVLCPVCGGVMAVCVKKKVKKENREVIETVELQELKD